MRIVLIRHAQSMGQEPDADLTPAGHAQAHALVSVLEALGAGELFSSPYRRAVATVAPFANRTGLKVNIVEDLRERKLAEGWLPDFMVHMERSFADSDYRLDGGESLTMTARRGLSGLAQVANAAQTSRPAVASHGNLIASLLRIVDPAFGFEEWKAMRNPHVFEVEFVGGAVARYRNLNLTR
jgi:2,3-bisphosphoglycerate-dependent phosphoglycerate mutase